ncbi:MAG: 16S rRNA (cytidine(1402)-2'-O)-methyltransferase [Micavibrio aeruginosavorus]|uniref:Ribosomal RNA small subunit methyltransferase I n=1 Tax=Micavibrio aeruginosavorus TaxID=349221 RepID=A0A2W5N3N3_9BACT|nr:MAG: 16S rRNA (cytidine(1402)-2'-O)-methyltransferase [Micavibrio aeruginosavorus]
MKSETTQKEARTPQEVSLKAGLYLVPTPIGNLRDLTFRALDVLAGVDLIVCEDTRVTGKLMKAFGLKKPMRVYNDHATEKDRANIIKVIEEGESVALVSDAGTPMISDPGYKLVREIIAQGHDVTALPGANAILPALQLSGLPCDAFSFIGFLPARSGPRKSVLEKWHDRPGTLICYETGPRLEESLKDIKKVLGDRPAAIARELTKLYEEVRRGKLSALIDQVVAEGAPKGEIVLIIGENKHEETISTETIEGQLLQALKSLSVRDAAELVAGATGKPKKAIYMLALKLSGKA